LDPIWSQSASEDSFRDAATDADRREEWTQKYLIRDTIILATQSISNRPVNSDFAGNATGVPGVRGEYQYSVKPEG
jgi:hypothetical protein